LRRALQLDPEEEARIKTQVMIWFLSKIVIDLC
jgi:hypothetical protein